MQCIRAFGSEQCGDLFSLVLIRSARVEKGGPAGFVLSPKIPSSVGEIQLRDEQGCLFAIHGPLSLTHPPLLYI